MKKLAIYINDLFNKKKQNIECRQEPDTYACESYGKWLVSTIDNLMERKTNALYHLEISDPPLDFN